MTRRTVQRSSKGTVGGTQGGVRGLSPVQAGVDALVAPMPEIPAALAGATATDNAVLVFPGQTITLGLTGPIRTTGGGPVVEVTAFEGREARMGMGAPETMTAQASCISNGPGADRCHRDLMVQYQSGRVFRLYGAMIGPGYQGMVWAFNKQPDIDPGALFNPDASLRMFKAGLDLIAWAPLGSLTPDPSSRVATGKARARSKRKGSTFRQAGGVPESFGDGGS